MSYLQRLELPYEITSVDKRWLFKFELTNALSQTCLQAGLLCSGDITSAPGWKDWTAQAGIGAATIIGTGGIAILAALGAIATIPGIAIPIGLTGLGAGISYNLYRAEKKKNQYTRVAHLFYDKDTDAEIDLITNTLLSMYDNTITCLTPRDIQKVTTSLAKALSYCMLKGKVEELDVMQNPAKLYQLLVSQRAHIPKESIETELLDHKSRNTRSAMTKAGFYVEHDPFIYENKRSRADKYGLLYLMPQDAEELREIMPTKPFKALPANRTKRLLAHSIFKPALQKIEERAQWELPQANI